MVSRHLPDALETLGRIPLIGERVASALEPRIGERALKHLLGPYRTWIYRTIETVTDERALQRLLLRLVQAQMPLYAQIRHGPLEYGKDIVALVEVEDHVLLQMYQVKAGDINVPLWSAVTYQLEQIFLVELDDVQLPVAPHSREGILIFNGHLNTYVEPIVAGWIKQQREQLGRSFRIMHLDDVVHWIIDSRLINELRQALAELGIPIVDA